MYEKTEAKFLVDRWEEDYNTMRKEYEQKTEREFEIIELMLDGFINDKKRVITLLRHELTQMREKRIGISAIKNQLKRLKNGTNYEKDLKEDLETERWYLFKYLIRWRFLEGEWDYYKK